MSELIYKQDAITELVFNEETKDIKCEDMRKVLNVSKKLPSVEPEQSIAEWQKDFREYINMLNIPRDDYNGIMEYVDDLPSAESVKAYTKADYIMALHKEYGCTLTMAEEAHNMALEHLRSKARMKG